MHLDIKGDNVCIPYGPANFDPDASGARLYPIFSELALIDFAFSLVSRESLTTPLPIGWQKDYDYQSPRLLQRARGRPQRRSAADAGARLALRPLQPRGDAEALSARASAAGRAKRDGRRALRRRAHADLPAARLPRSRLPHWRPHQQLMEFTGARLARSDLAPRSIAAGRSRATRPPTSRASPITPMTRIAPSIRAAEPIRIATPIVVPTAVTAVRRVGRAPAPRRSVWRATVLAPVIVALVALAAPPFIGDPEHPLADRAREALDAMRSMSQAAPPDPSPQNQAYRRRLPRSGTTPRHRRPRMRRLRARKNPARRGASAEDAREEPDAKPSSPMAEPQALSLPGCERALARRNAARPDAAGAELVTVCERDARGRRIRTLVRRRLQGQKQSRGAVNRICRRARALEPAAIVAAAAAVPASPPAVQVAAASADRVRQSHHPRRTRHPLRRATRRPRQPSPQSSAIANQSSPAEPTGTATEDRRTPTTGPSPHRRRAAPDEHRRPPSTATSQRPAEPAESAAIRRLADAVRKSRKGVARPQEPPAPVEERSVWQLLHRSATPRSRHDRRDLPGQALRSRPPRLVCAVPTEPSRAEASPSAIPAPLATPPMLIADARTQVTPSGIAAPPARLRRRCWNPSRPRDRSQDVLVQARRMVADMVPGIAAQAQPDVSRVLALAATANHRSQQQAVVDAARAKWTSERRWIPATDIEPFRARRLHDDARQAFSSGRVTDAVEIELRAFGANPRDPDIASYLAFLHIRMHPVQPETARQLALYAISVSGSRRSARFGDWDTLAVASALAGRDVDADARVLRRGRADERPRSNLPDRVECLHEFRGAPSSSGPGNARPS